MVAAPQALADPPTEWVNISNGPWAPPGTSCEHPGYQHIQDAVNAATPGTRINVCPGTYTEQVTVPAGKDNINLVSVQLWQAVIQAPPVMLAPRAIVHVVTAHSVGLIGFTVSGPLGPGCDNEGFGVRVDMSGSANIYGNHITKIQDSPFAAFGGCQD